MHMHSWCERLKTKGTTSEAMLRTRYSQQISDRLIDENAFMIRIGPKHFYSKNIRPLLQYDLTLYSA